MAYAMDQREEINRENRQLEAIARISKSQVAFERSLKELSMVCIFKNATTLHNSDDLRPQFQVLPPVLRRDFLKRLEAWANEKNVYFGDRWTDLEFENVFSLVRLLLDQSITEFNFCVYRMSLQRELETWRLLAQRCPNLTQLLDNRNMRGMVRNGHINVLPHLIKLRKLQRVGLQCFVFNVKYMEQLAREIPELCSLEASFLIEDLNNYDLLLNLFQLKKLEVLNLRLLGGVSNDENIHRYLIDEFQLECVRHLPALQQFRLSTGSHHCLMNSKFEILQQSLALRTVRIKGGFQGWSSEMLPHVDRLYLEGPLRDVNEFLGFGNLNSLALQDVSFVDTEKILRSSQFGLEELKLMKSWGTENISLMYAHRIFNLCPKLHKLKWTGHFDFGRSLLFLVDADNFQNLVKVCLDFQSGVFPSDLLAQIFTASGLEELTVYDLSLDAAQIRELVEKLKRKEILQHLREFNFGYEGGSVVANEALVLLLRLLPCHAPRLKKIYVQGSDEWDEFPDFVDRVKQSRLSELSVPDFEFEMWGID